MIKLITFIFAFLATFIFCEESLTSTIEVVYNAQPRASRHVVREAMILAAKKYNVKYSVLSKIADLESRFRSDVKNRYSTARGLFQLIESTERDLRKRCKISGDIFDAYVNSELGACLLRINTIYLQRKLGRTPEDWERYTLHFYGIQTGYRFIKMNDDLVGIYVFPRLARYNPYIFYKHGDKKNPRTISEIKELFKEKIKNGRVL